MMRPLRDFPLDARRALRGVFCDIRAASG